MAAFGEPSRPLLAATPPAVVAPALVAAAPLELPLSAEIPGPVPEQPAVPEVPRAEPVARGSEPAAPVTGSYFGPGLYGNGTACGQILTTALLGVAHRTLPCGTPVTLQYGSTRVTVPVVDRGPYVYSREFDLTYATKLALGCSDLCSLTWLR